MKQLIIIIVLLFSTLFNGSLTSAATAEYDHNELLDYPGYGEAMYESIVEQTTFISGRYTENKEYVNQSINQVTDYARGWWDEYMRISELSPKEKIREMINAAGGYALTVGDFIKNLFTDYEKDAPKEEVENPLSPFFTFNGSSHVINDGFYFTWPGHSKRNSFFINASVRYSTEVRLTLGFGGSTYKTVTYPGTFNNTTSYEFANQHREKQDDLGYMLGLMSTLFDLDMKIYSYQDNLEVTFPDRPNRNVQDLVKYINDGNISNLVTPQPKAYLSCPDGTRINMKINGGTFLDVKGNIMSVDKNGTATIDSQICNLGWEKPKIEYVDGTDQVGISTPDDGIIDAETGETIIGGNDEFDDEIKDGCGTLCALGKLLSGLGQIAKSIAGLATKILDGLFSLFVPDNLDFVTEEFDKMSVKLTDKFSLLTALKDTITGVFSSGDGGNPLSDINMSLPAAPNTNFSLDTVSFIEPFVPRIKQIISGILFLMTIIYVYRKITGRGGVMEK